MAKRTFKLPGIHDLSKEQEDVRALPLDGQHLIVGGPGTGKSVLALLRAKRLRDERKEYCFLVYNHLLMRSCKQFAGIELEIQQWQSWFLKIFRQMTGKEVPRPTPEPGSDWLPIDCKAANAIACATNIPSESNRPYLVIDEGQDMPFGFYQCLTNLGFENFFVMADQNQQITEENSNIQELRNALCLEPGEVIELRKNYRNKYAVARLAREFYTGDPASPPPDLPPPPKIQAKVPKLIAYDPGNFSEIIERIAKMSMSDHWSAKLIGIITPKNKVREQFFNALKECDINLDNGSLNISTFFYKKHRPKKHRPDVRFDQGGIMVINAPACKGLEFDIVFIVGLHDFRMDYTDQEQTKRRFYVMVARAIDTIIMLRDKSEHCAVEAILPTDQQILERS